MQNVVKLFTDDNPSALIDRSDFTECLTLLARLCGGRSSLPILSHIRLSSEPGGIAMMASNLDIQAETSIAADTDARFSAALPAAALLKLMKKGTPSNTAILELLVDETSPDDAVAAIAKCAVQLAGSRFVLDAQSTDDFPNPIRHAEEDRVLRLSIPSAVLWNALDGTIDAVSTDETRPYLNGVHIHNHNGHLRFVATDGHRLYLQDTNVQVPKSEEVLAILPTEGARFVASLLDGHASAEPVRMELSSTVAVFVFRDVAVSIRLIDGAFPDYQRVIPAEPDKVATVAGGTLSAAAVALSDCTKASHIRLSFQPDMLLLTASGVDGDGSTEVECSYQGDAFEIVFDAKNLRSAIEAASPDGRNMQFRMADQLSPVLVVGSIGGWTGVLMPTKA